MLPEPCGDSALVHHQLPCVLGLVLKRVHRHVWIVWHLAVATSRVVPRGSPWGLGSPAPTCTITNSAQSCACSADPGALVVSGHQSHRCWRVGWWTQELGPRHVHIERLVFAIRQHVADDVNEGFRRVVRRPLRGGRPAALTAVAPDVEVQAVRGHPRASVGNLVSSRAVDEA